MKIFCEKCGKEIEPKAKICPHCHAEIPKRKKKRTIKRKNSILIPITIVLIILIGIATVFLFTRKNPQKEAVSFCNAVYENDYETVESYILPELYDALSENEKNLLKTVLEQRKKILDSQNIKTTCTFVKEADLTKEELNELNQTLKDKKIDFEAKNAISITLQLDAKTESSTESQEYTIILVKKGNNYYIPNTEF